MSSHPCPIIDVQVHFGHMGRHVLHRYSADDLVGVLEREGVSFALVSSVSSGTIGQAFGTTEVLDGVARFPTRLGALVWVEPRDPAWQTDIERAMAQTRVYGIKLHPAIDGFAVDYESLEAIFSFADRHRLPIVTHAQDGTAQAENYWPLLDSFPDAPLVLYHFNARRPIGGILTAKRYPQVSLDTCFVMPDAIEIALDVVGPERILFGTDCPLGFDVGCPRPAAIKDPPRTYDDEVARICAIGLSDEAREAIFYRNAQRVFGISLTGREGRTL